ncbi:ParA family protein [Tropicimonas sp. IMCC34011]|uniref:ParA family protein n=1 Tax=Tropicimonas sp. IMCC34011 TaxID=2248759 RepID=UPI0018E54B1C|nr:ParA family protein [Tropicimonas sp. IMCC34011]
MAVANQKGGVGKTTTAINLSAALARLGKRVLILDLDPQGNASTGLGIQPSSRQHTTFDLLMGDRTLAEIALPTQVDNLMIAPATQDLASADIELGQREGRIRLLRKALVGQASEPYDHILVDCPPSLNLLTVNAMVAAHSVLVPLQSEFFALEGLSQLMLTLKQIRQSANPALRTEGIVLTMYDGRNRLSQQVEQDARDALGDLVFRTRVPRNVRISEAPSYAMPVLDYDPVSKGSQAYLALAEELLERNAPIAA